MPWVIFLLFIALLIPLVAVILDSHLGRALAEAISRGSTARPLDDRETTRRLAALETEVERLSNEVLRLEEETVFLHRLLEAKPAEKRELPPVSDET
jgi:hypothetical protein